MSEPGMKRFATILACAVICAALFAALAGCEQLNPRPPVDIATPIYATPVAYVAPPVSNGSIYQPSQYRPLFEDHRARLVGDSITVQIVEKISATQKSTSSIDKSGKLAASISALPAFSLNSFNRASAAGLARRSTRPAPERRRTPTALGTITAVVTGVLPNGHLLVAGEKQASATTSTCCAFGPGRPAHDPAGNVVASAQIANVGSSSATAAPGRGPGNRLAQPLLF
jgi:flagellar L-ring protein precursor FlgH